MPAIAQIAEHIRQNGNPVAKLWNKSGGTDLETQVMFPPGSDPVAHARIDEKYSDYPLAREPFLIGSNGRNWVDQRSVYLFFDIDSMSGHAAGHADESIQTCIDSRPEYVTLYRSKSGKGLGAMVGLNPQPHSPDRASHHALGDRLRERLKADGFPAELIDVCGGNGWFWSAETKPGGYEIIAEATRDLDPEELPQSVPNRKTFTGTNDAPAETPKELIAALNAAGSCAIWQPDQNCLHCHTYGLKQVHKAHNLPGRFETTSEGTNLQQPNCFFYPSGPMSGRVVRFGRGCREHESWTHDEWTSCVYGEPLSFADVFKSLGVATETGAYVLPLAKAAEAILDLTGEQISVPDDRPATVSQTDDGITVDIEKVRGEECPAGFRKHRRGWRQFVGVDPTKSKSKVFCGVRGGSSSEWFTLIDGQLVARSKSDCVSALSYRMNHKAVMKTIAQAAANPTPITKIPFKPQLHNGCLNPAAPQLVCDPQTAPATPDQFPTWGKVFAQTGKYLDDALAVGWGREHGIDGAGYIARWLAIALKTPEVRLPFLALFGGQLSGKSSFATAISVLIPGGVYLAAKQLRTDDKFDCSLEGMPFVFCDEVNLSQQSKFEYLKPWISESHGTVRAMYQPPRKVVNYTHWIQAVNRVEFLPIFDDTSRITAIKLDVIPVAERIDTDEIKRRLRAEAPAVLRYLLNLKLPPGDGRLALPAISTDIKDVARSMTDDPHAETVKTFLAEHCREGGAVSLKLFAEALSNSGGPPMKQNALAALLTNCGFTVKTRKGYPYLVGFEVQA